MPTDGQNENIIQYSIHTTSKTYLHGGVAGPSCISSSLCYAHSPASQPCCVLCGIWAAAQCSKAWMSQSSLWSSNFDQLVLLLRTSLRVASNQALIPRYSCQPLPSLLPPSPPIPLLHFPPPLLSSPLSGLNGDTCCGAHSTEAFLFHHCLDHRFRTHCRHTHPPRLVTYVQIIHEYFYLEEPRRANRPAFSINVWGASAMY